MLSYKQYHEQSKRVCLAFIFPQTYTLCNILVRYTLSPYLWDFVNKSELIIDEKVFVAKLFHLTLVYAIPSSRIKLTSKQAV